MINLRGKIYRLLHAITAAAVISVSWAQVPVGTVISNVATAEYRDLGGFLYSTVSDTAENTVSGGYQLEIGKTAGTILAQPGDTVVYTVLVTNSGNIPASGLTVTDTLDQLLEYVSSEPAASVSSGIASWDIAVLNAGETESFQISCLIADNSPAGAQVSNTAYLDSGDGIVTASETAVIDVDLAPVLRIVKTVDTATAEGGDTLHYSISVTNAGNAVSTNTTINDYFPDGLSFVSSTGNPVIENGSATWLTGNLEPGATASYTLALATTPLLIPGTVIVNTAAAINSEGSVVEDITETVVINSNLDFTKSAGSMNYLAGDTVDYTLSVTNSGLVTTSALAVSDSLPEGLEFLVASGSYQLEGGVIIWSPLILVPGQTVSLDVFAIVAAELDLGTVLTNTAALTDEFGFARSADYSIVISSEPATDYLRLEKQAGEAEYSPGDTVVYNILVENSGAEAAANVIVTDTVSQQLEFLNASPDYTADGNTVTWNLGSLAAGSMDTLTLAALILEPVDDGTIIGNTVYASYENGTRRSAETAIVVNNPPVQGLLVLSKTSEQDEYNPDQQVNYSITMENVTASDIAGVTVIDTLPAALEFLDASPGYVMDGNILSWTIGTVAAGTSDTLSVAAAIRTPVEDGTLIINSVAAQTDYGIEGPVSDTILVHSSPVLDLVKNTVIEVLPGDTLQYQIALSNNGTDAATEIVITDSLPSKISFLTASGNAVYDGGSHTVTWTLSSLDAGSSVDDYTLTAVVGTGLADGETIVNNISVTCAEEAGDRSSFTTTNILPLTLVLKPKPAMIMGNGIDYSNLTASVWSFLGNPVPDGFQVEFTASAGVIPDSLQTVPTEGGEAVSQLLSDLAVNAPVFADVTARVPYGTDKFAADTSQVIFLIGGYQGIIISQDGTPVDGAIVQLVQASSGLIVAADTTSADGTYFVPVLIPDDYRMYFITYDEDGNEVITEQPIIVGIPENGEIIDNLNSISGQLRDSDNNIEIRESGIPVILSPLPDSTGFAKTAVSLTADTTYTDDDGKYFFTNILPGNYRISVDYYGELSFSDIDLAFDISTPGLYIVNANLLLTKSTIYAYKTVDKTFAEPGDTLTYTIHYGSNTGLTGEATAVSDQLPSGLEMLEPAIHLSPGVTLDEYSSITNTVKFTSSALENTADDSIVFKARIIGDFTQLNQNIRNIAALEHGGDTLLTNSDSRSRAATRIIVSYLSVKKEVNRRVIERGDIVTYTVSLSNTSDDKYLILGSVTDILPPGFKYRRNSSVLEKDKIANPDISQHKSTMQMHWALDDTIAAGETIQLKYRSTAGLVSAYGENDNTVIASGSTELGYAINSNQATATVIVRPGAISDRGLIFGKVYYDLNGNAVHDDGEKTAAKVELIMENGIRVTTDSTGKYSIPNVRSGRHVLRVNKRTLPPNSNVILNSADFLGDPKSRSINVSPGGIAKANFALAGSNLGFTELATLNARKQAVTNEFRLLVYKPWSMSLRLGFLSGEANLRPETYSELRKVSEFMNWQQHVYLSVEGHTDDIPLPAGGQFANNEELSEARAQSIKDFLVDEMEIEASRIISSGFGGSRPVVPNNSNRNRAKNRRVELVFHTPEEDGSELARLNFRFDFTYSAEFPLLDLNYHETIPDGFTYGNNSSFMNGETAEPSLVTDTEVVWSLGAWNDSSHHFFDYALVPLDYTNIEPLTTASNYFTYRHPNGSVHATDTMTTEISSYIEELSLKLTLKGAQFDANSASLKSETVPSLNQLGEFLQWQDDLNIIIEGFTDDRGSLDHNMALSLNRARSIRDYILEKYDVSRDQIDVSGHGPHYPIADNETAAGRAQNRRVEILVNASVGQDLSADINITRESIVRVIEHLDDPFDAPQVEKGIFLTAGRRTPLRLYIKKDAVHEADQVKAVIRLPGGLLGAPGAGAGLESGRTEAVAADDGTSLIVDIDLQATEEFDGSGEIKIEVTPYIGGNQTALPLIETMKVTVE